MRLFLLPISTRRSLIYCQRLNRQLFEQQNYVDKITSKATTTWVKWEKFEKGWQKQVTTYGNKIFQRIPYEEWGLKSIPPLSARRKAEELKGIEEVPISFPKSYINQESVLNLLQKLATERQALHRKWMWGSLIGMPITAPFALIPIVPNLPFLYLVFRAWSHWRALSGSKHLKFLLENRLCELSPSTMLDTVYSTVHISGSIRRMEIELESLKDGSASHASQVIAEKMILSPSNGKLIAEQLEIPELEAEIERAIQQVETSLLSQKELEEEKQDLEAATKDAKLR